MRQAAHERDQLKEDNIAKSQQLEKLITLQKTASARSVSFYFSHPYKQKRILVLIFLYRLFVLFAFYAFLLCKRKFDPTNTLCSFFLYSPLFRSGTRSEAQWNKITTENDSLKTEVATLKNQLKSAKVVKERLTSEIQMLNQQLNGGMSKIENKTVKGNRIEKGTNEEVSVNLNRIVLFLFFF